MKLRLIPLSIASAALAWASAAVFSAESAPTPVPTVAVLAPGVKDGKVIFDTVCAACHGTRGEGKSELKSPAIAGLPDWYSKPQIEGFRKGRRGHDVKDPQSLMMAAIAKTLQPEQIDAVVGHMAKLERVTPAGIEREPKDADLANGMLSFQERCMECHRYNASGEMAFGSPPLIGQQGWYIISQIEKFKNGQRGTVKGDVNGAKMVLSSSFIEDDKMLRDIVAYILTLNPEPEVPQEAKSPFEAATR